MKVVALLAILSLITLACCSTSYEEEHHELEKRIFGKLVKGFKNAVNHVKNTVTNTVSNAGKGIKKAVDKTKEIVENVANNVEKTINKAVEKTKDIFEKDTVKAFKELEEKTVDVFEDFANNVKATYLDIARKVSHSAIDVGKFFTKDKKDIGHFFEGASNKAMHFFVKAGQVIEHVAYDVYNFCRKKVVPYLLKVDWEEVLRRIIPYIESGITVFACTKIIELIIAAIVGPVSVSVEFLLKFICQAVLHVISMGVKLLVDHYLPKKS